MWPEKPCLIWFEIVMQIHKSRLAIPTIWLIGGDGGDAANHGRSLWHVIADADLHLSIAANQEKHQTE